MSSGTKLSPNWERIPAKLITTILQLAIDEPVVLPPPPYSRRQDLKTICRTWKRVIETSPLLWSNVTFMPVEVADPEALLQFATQWIRRTSEIQVTIKLDGNFPLANSDRQATHTRQMMYGAGHFCIVQHIILPCSARIKSLTCTICTNETIRAFMNIPAGTFVNLQHLDVVFVNEFGNYASGFNDAELDTFRVFRGNRELRQLALHLLNAIHPLHIHIPWAQLTTIDLATRAMPPEVFRTILRRSKCLVQGCFLIKFTARGNLVREVPKRVTAPALRNLQICLMQPNNDPLMLKKLVTPVLVDLRIELEDRESGWILQHYLPILKKANILERLTLAPFTSRIRIIGGLDERSLLHKEISNAEMAEFLLALTSVKSLHLPLAIPLSIPILNDMADGNYLPRLAELELGSKYGYAFHVLSMVQRRNELVTNPRAVSNRCAETSAASGVSSKIITPPLCAIASLALLVEAGEQGIINAEVSFIQRHGLCADTKIRVEGCEARLFYHPK